jgi:hypothetical protein
MLAQRSASQNFQSNIAASITQFKLFTALSDTTRFGKNSAAKLRTLPKALCDFAKAADVSIGQNSRVSSTAHAL